LINVSSPREEFAGRGSRGGTEGSPLKRGKSRRKRRGSGSRKGLQKKTLRMFIPEEKLRRNSRELGVGGKKTGWVAYRHLIEPVRGGVGQVGGRPERLEYGQKGGEQKKAMSKNPGEGQSLQNE